MLRIISLFTFLIITCLHFSCETDVSDESSYLKENNSESVQMTEGISIEYISSTDIPGLNAITKSEQYQVFLSHYAVEANEYTIIHASNGSYAYNISYESAEDKIIDLVLYPYENQLIPQILETLPQVNGETIVTMTKFSDLSYLTEVIVANDNTVNNPSFLQINCDDPSNYSDCFYCAIANFGWICGISPAICITAMSLSNGACIGYLMD